MTIEEPEAIEDAQQRETNALINRVAEEIYIRMAAAGDTKDADLMVAAAYKLAQRFAVKWCNMQDY